MSPAGPTGKSAWSWTPRNASCPPPAPSSPRRQGPNPAQRHRLSSRAPSLDLAGWACRHSRLDYNALAVSRGDRDDGATADRVGHHPALRLALPVATLLLA